MMCKKQWTRTMEIVVFALGLVSFLFGLLSFLIGKPDGHSANTLLGMFTGFGFGIMAVAAYKTIRQKVVSKEKLEQEKIDQEDERNIAIIRAACAAAYAAAIVLFAVLIFVFMGLGYSVPSYICLGAMYVLVAVFAVAKKVLEKRM